MTPEISITTSSYNTPEWAELLIKSVRKFTTVSHEIVVVDNGSLNKNKSWLRSEATVGRIRLHENPGNAGHGAAIDQGTELARGRFVCAMDIDSFFMRPGWDADIIQLYESDPAIRLIAKRGHAPSVTTKPLSAPIFFYDREFAVSTSLQFIYAPGKLKGSTDNAQAAYWQIVDAGYRVKFLSGVGRMATNPGGGEIVEIAGQPSIYHHFYGSRFGENWRKDAPAVDGRTFQSHLDRKAELFNQPLIKDILAWT